MALTFIGKDPPSKNGDSPSLWVDETDGSVVVQAWSIPDHVVISEALAASGSGGIPAGEVLGRLPATMLPLLEEVVDALHRRQGAEPG